MPKLLRITASDKLYLPGLLYCAHNDTKTLFVFVHGAGSSSIVRNTLLFESFSQTFNTAGADLLTFMNRGAGYITKFDTAMGKSQLGGMTYEKISDFIYDIKGVVSWAREHRYENIYLLGHSTGANKLALVADYINRQEDIKGVALLAGGDDIALQRSALDDALVDIQRQAEEAISTYRDTELAPINTLPHPISWRSLYELITVDSNYDIFHFSRRGDMKRIQKITKPTLVVYGSEDFGTIIKPAIAVRVLVEQNKHIVGTIINGADHNFTGYETELAKIILAGVKV